MFGLTKREQRWAAEQKAAETLATFAATVHQARAQVEIAEAQAKAGQLTEDDVRRIVREELARANLVLDKSHDI